MSILQISSIKVRSGNLVDLPQLDEGEFGLATDVKRVFIGKTTPNENIEMLTAYSQIDYSQINGSVGNLNINSGTAADGQVLTFDGDDWVNRGGDAGGLITLGDVSNVRLTGGAIGYVLETDGLGNLSWTPKSTVITYIQNVTQASPAVVTTVENNFLTEGLEVTITDAAGMTQLNGNTYYANIISSNTFSLYTDAGLTTPLNAAGFTAYAYTSVSNTTISTNVIDVGNAAVLTVNAPIRFLGSMENSGIENDVTYYVKTRDTGANTITVSSQLLANGVAGSVVALATETGLTANVYQEGGRVIAAITSGGSAGAAGGSNTTVQINNNNLLDGDADFTFDFGAATKLLNVNGNANVGNLNATGRVSASRLFSNVTTGTTPIQVSSTTRVPNLSVAYANVSDFGVVTTQTTGTFYPILVNGNTTANYALGSNANLTFNAATGNLGTTLLNVTGNANVGNIGVSGVGVVTGNLTAGNLNTAGFANIASASGRVYAGTDDGGSVTIGRVDGTASSPYIDFNTSATVVDYDVRLQATGNTGTLAGGLFTIEAANVNVSAILNVAGNLTAGNISTAGAITAASGTITANLAVGNLLSNGSIGGATATLFATTLTTGANTTAGTVTGNWTLSTGSRMQATYADLAEYYEADEIYEPGTVLEFGGEKEVTLAYEKSAKVAGIVSDRFAYIMNAGCPGNKVAVALQGRVPCKIQGSGKKGDMMISAGNGFAKACTSPKMGTVLGKSLVDFDGSVDTVIEIAVGRL